MLSYLRCYHLKALLLLSGMIGGMLLSQTSVAGQTCSKSSKVYVHKGKAINPLTGLIVTLTPVDGKVPFLLLQAKNLTGKELALVQFDLEIESRTGKLINSEINLESIAKNGKVEHRFAWPETGVEPSISYVRLGCPQIFDINVRNVSAEINVFSMPPRKKRSVVSKK